MAKVSVIIPAAGAGRRFGPRENKIFQNLAGRAILLRTVEIFAARSDVCQILLVCSARDIETVRCRFGDELDALGAVLVEGGPVRAMSVSNALAHVCDEAELVCVHDAVRPCVAPLQVDAVFRAAALTGAAILADPLHGTLKKVRGEKMTVEQTLPRENLWQAQTPQVFSKQLLLRAYAGDIRGATDDAQLVEAAGGAVTIVCGGPENIKITTPADLALAEAIIRAKC
jgi:2-C-methyl-D-erythritol 4-phosphate cytidylyltransferase